MSSLNIVKSINVKKGKTLVNLIKDLGETGFQGRSLAEVCFLFNKMIEDKEATIILGYSGSLSTTGQWKIVQWFLENELVDILVSTGANISEDIVEALGYSYYQGSIYDDDKKLFEQGYNRYYDVYGREDDYYKMTELISQFIIELDCSRNYSSREFLYEFGLWLERKKVYSIVTSAALKDIPIFCPAIADSPFGDAALLAKNKKRNLIIDCIKDYTEFMSLSEKVDSTGVVYIGGGVPKDFIQLLAVSPVLSYPDFLIPTKKYGKRRKGSEETSYPHKYAIQITTDSPQWGGLSGCTFKEAISWGKETLIDNTKQCYCDATIALPIISHYLSDVMESKRVGKKMNKFFSR